MNMVNEAEGGQSLAVAQNYPSSRYLVMILFSLMLGTLLVAIDTTIIAVAIPKISADFKALDQIGWFGSAYLLTLTAIQPIFGTVYRFFGAKRIYLVCVVIFEVGSTLCAAAPSSTIFFIGRAVAAVGSAGLIQGALAIVTFVSPLEKRPTNLAIVVSIIGISTPLGPVLGGVLTDRVSWRWCFWINLPVGAVVVVLVMLFVKVPSQVDEKRDLPIREKVRYFDFWGAILLLGAICSFFLALQMGGKARNWVSSKIIGLFVGSGFMLAAFAWSQWKRGDDAIIPTRILRQRSVLTGCCFLFFVYMSSYIWDFYLPIYFQAAQGVSPIISGVQMIPLALSVVVAIGVTAAIVTKYGHYVPFMVLGQIILVIGTAFLTRLNAETPTRQWATFMVIAGLGLGMGMQLPYTALQVVLSENDVLIGNALTTLFGQLGGAITLCVGETLFINGLTREVSIHTDAIPVQVVIDAGASNVTKMATSPAVLHALREAYAKAVSNTLVFSLSAACAAVPCAIFMEWLNVKKVAKTRRDTETSNIQLDGLEPQMRLTVDADTEKSI